MKAGTAVATAAARLASIIPALKTERVDSYRQLRARMRDLARQHRGRKLVLRGQTALYGGAVIPSIMRRGHERYRETQHALWYTLVSDLVFSNVVEYQQWRRKRGTAPAAEPAPEAPERPAAAGSLGSHIERLLQHYGARSNYVDVTSSLPVALWFAHHSHNLFEQPYLPADVPGLDAPLDPFGPMPVYEIAWYTAAWPKTKTGYLLTLAPNLAERDAAPQHGDYVELTPNLMSARIGRQRAGLIYANKNAGDLRKLVVRAFRFKLPLAGAPRFVTDARTNALFPSPDADRTYAGLLARGPFRTDLTAPHSMRRIISIPEYYESSVPRDAAWRAFRRHDVYRPLSLFFPRLYPQDHPLVVCRVGDRDVRLRDATPVLGPLSISMIMDPTMIADLPEFSLHQYGANLFVEFDLLRGGIIAETPIAPSEPRGVWVVADGNRVWCRLFVNADEHDESKITGTDGHWFALGKEKGLTLIGGAPDGTEDAALQGERQLLGYVLSLLADVTHGSRTLSPSEAAPNLPPYLSLSEELIEFP